MKKLTNLLLILVAAIMIMTGCISTEPAVPSVPYYGDIQAIIKDMPDGQVWLNHLQNDLLPYWTMEDALGTPPGHFPTYRSNAGKLIDPNNLPPEIAAALGSDDTKGLMNLDRTYVRAQARQTFAYGIAYHMTGEERYLLLAKTGVDFLRQNALDTINDGGAYSYYSKEKKEWGPEVLERTSQDMAYALSGIGFY